VKDFTSAPKTRATTGRILSRLRGRLPPLASDHADSLLLRTRPPAPGCRRACDAQHGGDRRVFPEGKTEEKIWVGRSADSHIVVFTLSEDGMGLTGESQVIQNPNSALEREVIAAPARRAAYEFLRKLHSMREQ
jgi:hypothetical protein